MNEQVFAALSCIQFVILVAVMLLFVYRNKLIEIEEIIRQAFNKKRDGSQVVRVVKDFYGRNK